VRAPVRRESLRLPPRAIQGQHELTPEPLTKAVSLDERLELRNEVGIVAERKVSLDSLLQRQQAQLLEPHDLRLHGRLGRNVDERRPAPLCERFPQLRGLCLRLRRSGLRQQRLEAGEVELSQLDLELVGG
jgi:hypothetical protein